MNQTQIKASNILDLLISHEGCEVDAIKEYKQEVLNQQEPVLLMYSDRCVEVLVGSLDYLYIYPDNTVTCSRDDWGKSMYFKVDIFNKVMEL